MSDVFQKLLIANRGEIAVRVIRTCRRLGIQTVAIYSEPDARALHVQQADEAVALGGSAAAESYLLQERVIDAAVRTGCDAVHPGYGFLSENPTFAAAVRQAGLTFVGPPAEAIVLMGDKIAAKALATKSKVPTVPGMSEPTTTAADATEAADNIGYPVLLKPAAGGGGKGMRIVHAADEIESALAACMAEASKAFGDDRVFVERYIARPRHIEIQILADSFGNVVHLGERECSIQRRYQKIIEEAPSVAVDEELRQRMGGSACELARAAGYVNAGTVEFIADPAGNFYFLEMNTRLQVEHPVTELVTGLDLVEQQLRIAAGGKLGLTQDDIELSGWAIEARVCAEDPDRGFIPSIGPITRYAEPHGPHVRVDSGVAAGSRVSVYYDSLLAKLIANGDTREAARAALVDALNGYDLQGPATNIDFVNTIVNHPAFIAGDLSTDFIERHLEEPAALPPPPTERLHHMAIAAALVYHNRHTLLVESIRPMAPTTGGVRQASDTEDQTSYVVKAGDEAFRVRLQERPGPNAWTVHVDDTGYGVVAPEFEFYRRRLRLEIGGERYRFLLRYEGHFIRASHSGTRRTFEVYTPREWELAVFMPPPREAEDSHVLTCPMPGLVVAIRAEEGQRVYAGQVLLTLESMKMESGVPAPRDGVVRSIQVTEGQAVEAGDVLVEFEE